MQACPVVKARIPAVPLLLHLLADPKQTAQWRVGRHLSSQEQGVSQGPREQNGQGGLFPGWQW